MTDFTDILPADLLPEAVREYVEESKRLDERYGGGNISDSDFWSRRWADDYSDAAIAAALELAASLMVCGTCGMRAYLRSTTGDIMASQCIVTEECVSVLQHCECKPSRWQHYREAIR